MFYCCRNARRRSDVLDADRSRMRFEAFAKADVEGMTDTRQF